MTRFAVGLSLVLVLVTPLFAQSDPQAVTYAAQAMSALTGGNPIMDATLTGTATRIVGSDQGNGPTTLYAKGQFESRLVMNLSSGNRSEIRNSLNNPQGEWIDADGNPNQYALHNCFTDAVWFFPALSSLASANDPHEAMSYVGLETFNGASVQHLRSVRSGEPLSTMDLYLDAVTFLPLEIDYSAHADQDANIDIPVQVVFSSYANINGAAVLT